MAHLQDLLASSPVVKVGELSWRLSRPTLSDLGAIEAQIVLSQHEADETPARSWGSVSSALTPRRIAEWVASRAGTRFVLWLSCQRQHPDLTLQEVDELVEQVVATEIERPPAIQTLRDVTPAAADVPLDWHRLLRELARRYGWTPTQIADLTLLQVQMVCGRRRRRRRWLTRHAAACWRAACERERTAASSVAPSLAAPDRAEKCRNMLPMLFEPFEVTALAKLTVANSDRRWRRRAMQAAARDRTSRHEAHANPSWLAIESVMRKQFEILFARLRKSQSNDTGISGNSSIHLGTTRFE